MPTDTSTLLWGLLFGSIGFGLLIYGKRQRRIVPFACGLVLVILPYFTTSNLLLVALGSALVALPYFLRL
jgi:hypothetical protein